VADAAGPRPAALEVPLSEGELCPDALLRGQEQAFARDIARLQQRLAEFVVVACPACAGDDARPEFAKHGFRYVRCRRCRTLYMTPRPSPGLMAEYYRDSDNYRYWAQHVFPASEAARREKLHRPWLDRVLDYCSRHRVPRGVLLEIGPGFGTFASLAQASGAFRRVVAVEANPEMARACRERGVDVVERRIEELATELTAVDVAVAFEVIEHLFAPRSFLDHCARLTRPGGLLVLSCPNGEGFDIATLGSRSLAVDPEHVNLFNPASLGLLVGQAGYEVLEVSTPGRLDAEFVRTAILDGTFDVSGQPLLRRILVEEWERLGWPFQQFLAGHGLSSHMWLAARRR
jgi:2-polyprenyl-3-methyl-5-hydroxy-6-metoxy-1,4-benzoquinol methylase